MAAEADDPKVIQSPTLPAAAAAAIQDDGDSDGSSSDSDSEPGQSTPASQIEWLATGRAKRSTAGNRMKSMLANETPADEDSDLELLFQEDEDDAGFTDKEGADGSDVQMDSSDDDEDDNPANANGGGADDDDDEGEKELERQAKEKKAAARKRKAQEAIPAKFRKKVRISRPAETPPNGSAAAAAQPRPKKKSERASWLPTQADLPTRASERKTTRLSKEQLHQQMVEREARRKKQVEAMERKAKKLEAMKKPPMTQAERLLEAAIVEKRNSKSLNRWEEAEKQREEERRAKLAALHDRRLEGPVVSFWTGIVDLSKVQLKHVGKMVSMEEKPKRKRPSTAVSATTIPSKTENEPIPPTTTTPASAVPKIEPGLSDTVSSALVAPIAPIEAPTASEEASTEPKPSKPEFPPVIPSEATTSQASAPNSTSLIHSPATTSPPVSTPPVFTPPLPASTTLPRPASSQSISAPAFAPPVDVTPAPPATSEAPVSQITPQSSNITQLAPLASRPISPATISKPSVQMTSSGVTIPPIPLTTASPSPVPAPSSVKAEPQAPKSLPFALKPNAGPRFMPPPNPHLAQTAQFSGLAPPAGVPSVLNGPLPVLGYAAARVHRSPGYIVPVSPIPQPVVSTPQVSAPAPSQAPSQVSFPSPLQGVAQSPSPAFPQTSFQVPPQAPPQPPSQPTPQAFSPASSVLKPSEPDSIPAPVATPSVPLPKALPSPSHTTASFAPIAAPPPSAKTAKKQPSEQSTTKKAASRSTASRKPPPPPEPPEPELPMEGKVTRSCIILQDFDQDAVKKPEVQTQILFGRRMTKLGKPPQAPLCVITNHPARYRDPKTGLHFYNVHAFKKIQKLVKGDFRWSQAMGTWVGQGDDAAKGVPKRFTQPETEEEHRERLERKELEKKKLAEEEEQQREREKERERRATTDPTETESLSINQRAPSFAPSDPLGLGPDDAAEHGFAATVDPAALTVAVPPRDATDLSPSVPVGVPAIMPSPDDVKPDVETLTMPEAPSSGAVPTNPAETFEMEI